jgi:hypothetical protein
MEKEFIPYKQALELAKLNFNEKCFGYYGIENKLHFEISGNLDSNLTRRNFLAAPTFSQVFRWFREKYNLFCEIQIDRTPEPEFCFDIFQYEHFGNYEKIEVKEWYLYRTQEEVELECLKTLIEIVKQK